MASAVALPRAFTQSTMVVERHAAQPESRLECTCAKLRRCPPARGQRASYPKTRQCGFTGGQPYPWSWPWHCPVRSLNQPLFVERHAARPESRRPSAAAASCGRLECTCAKLRRCPPPAGSGHRVWPISVDTAASCAKRARTLQLPHERAMWHGISMLTPRDRNMLAGEQPKAKSHISRVAPLDEIVAKRR